jgi:hypothetical protein
LFCVFGSYAFCALSHFDGETADISSGFLAVQNVISQGGVVCHWPENIKNAAVMVNHYYVKRPMRLS